MTQRDMIRKDGSLAKVGGICSILLGISYILVGLFHSLIPTEQRAEATSPGSFYLSFNQAPTFSLLEWWALAVGALLAFAAMPAISERVRMLSEGWVRWATGLALLGFATEAMIEFHSIARHPVVADVYVQSSEAVRAAIAAEPLLFIDPHGWLRFGVVGLYFLVVNMFAIRGRIGPMPLAYIGIASAFLYWTLIAGFATSNETYLPCCHARRRPCLNLVHLDGCPGVPRKTEGRLTQPERRSAASDEDTPELY